MADDNGPLTFDALSEMYRVQRNSPTLSPIRRDFYTAAQELLAAQSKECDRLLRENPTSIMYDGAVAKKRKISTTLKDIVEMRMKRIADMAARGAMGANNVIDNLTPEEKVYYNSVLEASKVFWTVAEVKKKTMVSQDITEIAAPAPVEEKPAVKAEPVAEKPVEVPPAPVVEEKKAVLEDVPLSEIPMDDSPEEMPAPVEEVIEDEESGEIIGPAEVVEEVPVEVPEEIPEDIPAEQPAEPEPVAAEVKEEDGNVTIRILEDLPPFSGPEYNYNLKKEDIVRMPAIMANALINRGVARIVPTA